MIVLATLLHLSSFTLFDVRDFIVDPVFKIIYENVDMEMFTFAYVFYESALYSWPSFTVVLLFKKKKKFLNGILSKTLDTKINYFD